jgi:hypothetical protein
MVRVLAIEPNVHGFKLSRGRLILRTIKIRSMVYFKEKIKPSAPCRKILRHVKNPSKYERDTS